MKILITCLSRSWGGMEMYTLLTAIQLRKQNYDVEILCYNQSRFHKEAENENFRIITSAFKNYFHPAEVISFAKEIKKKSYDLIHSGGSQDLWLVVPALKIAGNKAPLILSKHVGSFIKKKDIFHKWIYNRVTFTLAISNVIKKNLIDTTPLPEEKILLLHNGINTKKFDPEKVDRSKVRNEFNILENELLIGMTARFSPGKGHEEFLYAAGNLLAKHNNLRFMIVGEPSKGEDLYAEKIKTLAKTLNVSNKTILTGFRKDTPEIYAAMDIFVFPSHAEAFGLALVEAMSMEKPSVCSNSDGVLDIAVDGITSYLFEKQNWEDLTHKIEKLILSPETRKSFGIAARKRAVEMFDLEIFTDKLIKIYERVMS
ncbi:MAG: glycosyltransferase family 4 protein [Bacteroidota bacterium]